MGSLIKSNGHGRGLIFSEFPSLFDDFLTRDIFHSMPARFQHAATVPAVNVKETENAYGFEMAVPGMDKKDFKIELNQDTLVISSKQEQQHEEKNEDGKIIRKEFSYQSFSRSFRLPEDLIDTSKIEASYKDGILHVSVPKKEKNQGESVREIQVN
ncbi:MAG: Hsp20/alpha crystallin family protein [Bacteroidetes bacterium]|nr:Hsp20/alpha crystallin family protein [Bacteroidota bacterium]